MKKRFSLVQTFAIALTAAFIADALAKKKEPQ
jgi:hypothetical protein